MNLQIEFSKLVTNVGWYHELRAFIFSAQRLLGFKQKEFQSLKKFYQNQDIGNREAAKIFYKKSVRRESFAIETNLYDVDPY